MTLVASVAVVGLQFLGDAGGSSLDQAGQGIDRVPPAPTGGSGGSDGGGGGSGSGDGSGSGGATTTSAVATTTTTAAVTTTAPAAPASAAFDDARGVRDGYYRWEASAELRIDAEAASRSGTAEVRVRTWRANGTWTSETIEVSIGADGRASVETGPYTRTGTSRITAVEYLVVDVELDDGHRWDGERPSVVIERPG